MSGAALACGSVGAAQDAAPQQTPFSRELLEAAAAEKAGDYAAAAALYRQVLVKLRPARVSAELLLDVRVRLAKDYYLLHRYEDSLKTIAPDLTGAGNSAPATLAAQATLVGGLDDLELNRLPLAIGNLRRSLALNPASGTARLALGDAYARSSQLEEAAQEYQEELARAPQVAEAWYKLGVVYSILSGRTVQDFLQRRPDDPVLEQLAAERLLASGNDWKAIQTLLAVRRAAVRQAGLKADLGTALLDLGYTKEAGSEFKAELAGDPESPPAQFGLAEIAALQGNWPPALERFLDLLRFQLRFVHEKLESPPPKPLQTAWREKHLQIPAPLAKTSEGKLLVGWLTHTGIDMHMALPRAGAADCRSLRQTISETPGLWLQQPCYELLRARLEKLRSPTPKLAEADFRLGRYQDAQAVAAALSHFQPGNSWGTYWLAESYGALANECFERLASISPNSAQVHEMLAQLDANRFQWARAEKEYQAALRLAPGLPDLHLGLGTVYWQAGDWLRAEQQLKETLELDPSSRVATYELGDCYVQKHQWNMAVPHLQQALGDAAVSFRARLDLAQAEEETGHPSNALNALLPVAAQDADGVLHYRLAMLYRKLGKATQAQDALAKSQFLRQAAAKRAQQELQQAQAEVTNVQQSR
ncbi:MAG TPA: tetratricopeptide repeat protein [Terriglobia bacterium]|nr:tetratricopeptide repeat protein [Terriglobia bacterium]